MALPVQIQNQKAADIKKYIRRRLGEPIFDVELEDDHLNDAIDDATRWIAGILDQLRIGVVATNGAGGEYPVPDDCQEVVDVYFEEGRDKILDVFDWAGVELSPVGYGSYFSTPSGAYSYIQQWQSYLEQGKKIVGVDPMWEYDRFDRILRLYPSDGRDAGGAFGSKVAILYQTGEIALDKLHNYEYDLVRRYALAMAMEALGYIRTKYATVPSAQGEQSLNGDTLLGNAEALRNELTEKAKTLRRPLNFSAY